MYNKAILAGAMVVASLGAASVEADGAQNYNGVECVPYDSDTVNAVYDGDYQQDNGTSGTVICPVTRHNTSNTNGLSGLKLYYHDATSGGLVCVAYSGTSFGNVDDSATQISGATGDNYFSWGTTIDVSSNKGSYVISCILGQNDKIYSYWASEP